MDKKLNISENLVNQIFAQESQKIVGKCLKRFELSDNKDDIKKQVKEILYESLRDLRDYFLMYGQDSINLTK
jgi:hypothetical protein